MTETVVGAAAGIVKCEHRKAAIIGTGPGRRSAPWGDLSWCKWAINEIWQPELDRHYELHPMSVQSERDLAWLAQCPTPCYVLNLAECDGKVKNAVQYPIQRVLAMPGARDWFTSTFSYQVALAILDGFEEIGLWGVDLRLGSPREQTVEWAGLSWWLGYAAGRGMKVTLDGDYTWTHPGRYGYDYHYEKYAVERQMRAMRDAFLSHG